MREAKVRAWDVNAGEMLDGASLAMLATWGYNLLGQPAKYARLTIGSHDRPVELMQYTGLKDKNDVEIYEGDILRSTENENVYLVEEFVPIQRTDNLTRLGVYIEGEYHKVPEELLLGDDWKSWPEMYEVIGNIYEHKHLLEGGDDTQS